MHIAAERCELWGPLGDYVLTRAGEAGPRDAVEIGGVYSRDGLRSVLSAALAGSPGNATILQWFLGTHAREGDEVIDEVVERVSLGRLRLWKTERSGRCEWPCEDIPRLSDLLPRDERSGAPTWIEVGVVDQFGRPLPWMLARLRLPNGSTRDRRLDAEARTREDAIPTPGACRLELRAPAPEVSVATSSASPPASDGAVGVAEPAWLGLRVVDQFGRPLPWMRARLTAPPLEIPETGLDDDARGRLQFMAAAQRCTVEVRASPASGVAQ